MSTQTLSARPTAPDDESTWCDGCEALRETVLVCADCMNRLCDTCAQSAEWQFCDHCAEDLCEQCAVKHLLAAVDELVGERASVRGRLKVVIDQLEEAAVALQDLKVETAGRAEQLSDARVGVMFALTSAKAAKLRQESPLTHTGGRT